ncbi:MULTISPECIES: hypothetical protein [Ramlibacter]|uniref:Uncharacterized protein n=1 Tax=Ramlibacter pinisoli TaxID=2682844 RepID=A0A6N8J3B4_9BURK|nr:MULTISPECIES: hypothetical protein [Ramlibacter]MBA2962877.1 hypothetical protein [Ramlibacter sp. CGMCC 1.13660]MVQ32820.1 hypothetical protein [Ramlibacter pinisoli]
MTILNVVRLLGDRVLVMDRGRGRERPGRRCVGPAAPSLQPRAGGVHPGLGARRPGRQTACHRTDSLPAF